MDTSLPIPTVSSKVLSSAQSKADRIQAMTSSYDTTTDEPPMCDADRCVALDNTESPSSSEADVPAQTDDETATQGPVDIDCAALGPEQGELVKLLEERGAVEGLIDTSTGDDVKVLGLAGVFHDERDKIIDFLLTDCEQGKFRRKTLQEYDEKEGVIHRLVYWKYYDRRSKVIEFLLDVKVVSPDKSTNIMELAPLDEDDLSDKATAKLVEILALTNTKTVKRGVIKGELSFTDFEFGQTAVTMVGTLKAEERATEMKPEVNVRTVKSFKSVRSTRSRVEGCNSGRIKKGDAKAAYAAVKGIVEEVGKKFRQPAVIDDRRKMHFVEEIMPRAPPLTIEEEAMMGRAGRLEKGLHTKGKRVKGTLKEGIDKLFWWEEGQLWAAMSMNVDTSATRLLAELYEMNTYERSQLHKKKHGSLPRAIRKKGMNSRSTLYCVAMSFPGLYENRVFQTLLLWKKATLKNTGRSAFVMVHVPRDGNDFQDINLVGCIPCKSFGALVITELAPNICSLTKIETNDLKMNLPRSVLETLAKFRMKDANRLQEKFRRNGKKVDAEVRGALMERMREGVELEEDQKKVFGELEELFGGEEEEGWGPLESPYGGVKMKIKNRQQKKGERSIALGKAWGVADCSAEEAAAYYFEYCSRDRNALSRDEGNPARLEIIEGEGRINEKAFATIKTMPLLLHNREFVFKHVWQKNNDDSITVVCCSVDKDVDYGGNTGKLVRGITKALFIARNIKSTGDMPQCKIQLLQFLDAGGHIPITLINKKIPLSLQAIYSISDALRKDELIDKAALASLANIIKNEKQDYTDEEEAVMRDGKEFYEKCMASNKFKNMKSPDPRVKMKAGHVDGEGLVVGLCETVLDASLAECVAYEFIKDSRQRQAKLGKKYKAIEIKKQNSHSQLYLNRRSLGVRGFSDREWRASCTWQMEEGGKKCWTVYKDTDMLNEDFPLSSQTVLASGRTTWMFEALTTTGGVPQTKVTFASKVDIKGSVPSFVMNHLTTGYASNIIVLRKKFDKSKEIDAFKRQQIIAKFEEVAIEGAPGIESHFDEIAGAQEISSGLIGQTLIKAEKGMGWGKTSITVRASHKEVAAFFWDVQSRLKSKVVLHRINNKTLVITVDHKVFVLKRSLTSSSSGSNTEVFMAFKFSEAGQNKTDVEIIARYKGVGKAASKRSVIKHLSMVTDAAYYFDNLLKSTEAVEQDGRRFGEQLMERVKERKFGDSKVLVARDFIAANRTLREITEQHGFMRTMLYAVVMNKLKRRATNEGEDNSEEEARGWEIGSAMTAVMLSTATAAHAVDEWAHQFTEVQEVMNEQEWVRPMLEEIVKQLFMKSAIGLKARVTVGAATSMLDLLTDVYVTYMLWSDKKFGYFKASLASLMVSIGFQMLAVWVQNRKLGTKRVVREWIPILFGYKPAVDAYRVATGAKQDVGAVGNPMLEMTTMKVIEMFAEAIPGVIIQLMAIVTSDKNDVGTSAWLSVAVSAITTGFASATISYDWDTDPAKREEVPDFYGYIPAKASKRTVAFVSMMLFTAGMLLIRCTTIVLLGLMGGSWAFLYIGADLGLYLLIKILRRDFWYWMPVGGKTEILNSISFRVMVKIIVDFTSIVHFRHPNEVGGVYWLFSLVLTMGSLPVSIYVASPHVDENAIDVASTIVKYTILVTTLCFAVFFLNIEKKYLDTFWSTQRGKDKTMAYFLEGESDAIKFSVFKRSKHHWVSIEGEIKKWVGLNWAKWEEEQPEWFTDVMKAKVPVDFIPSDGDARRRESVRRASVDAEAEGGLAGSLRAGIRRASVGLDNGGALIASHAVNDTIHDYAGLDPNKIGKLLGEQLLVALIFRKKGMTKEEAVRLFIGSNYILRQAAEKYAFVTPMLGAVVKNKLCKLKKVEGRAAELVENEGTEIGESLARSLAINTQPIAAVDAFILNFPALQELDEEYEWFRPMLEAISYSLLEEVPWGLKMRVTVGAITSMADLLTDVYVTYMFFSGGKDGYFEASLASLGVSIGIQLLLVWGQNKKLGMVRVIREWFPILIGFKPAVDAYRVAKGEKQEAGQALDALTELTYMKGIEMFAEAIPGVIIQLMAIVTNKGKASRAAWVSLIVSALTTGFASATIGYDWDTDPVRRIQVPDFYGYVPANPSKRSIIFVAMMFFSACMLVIRCMTIVVLGLLGGTWVSLYVGADLGLYLLVKILRGDFWYWMPVGGNAEIVSSIIARVLVKVVTDFTSIMQFRHPNEVGGMYWIFGFVLTMGSLPIAILVAERVEIPEEKLKLAWKVVGIFIPCTILLFAVFFFNIEKRYWGTFYSLQRGNDLTVKNFKEGSDAVKAKYTFKYSKHHWKAIEEEVKAWVEANWDRWEEEKPDWFDKAMRARVPVEYIPESGDARRRESVRRANNDADAEGGLAGAFRASIRRASVGGANDGGIIEVGGGKAKVSSVLPKKDKEERERSEVIQM